MSRVNIKAGIKNIFAIPIVQAELPADAAETLMNFYTPYLPSETGNATQHTDYNQDRDYGMHPILIESIKQLSEQLMNTLYSDLYVPEPEYSYWIQDYKKNQYHHPHLHPNAILSGIYVLRSNDLGTPLTLKNPDNSRGYRTDLGEWYDLDPKLGRLYIWPSWLYHHVKPQTDDDVIRTTFVFNIGGKEMIRE